jgi:hypothetical protein
LKEWKLLKINSMKSGSRKRLKPGKDLEIYTSLRVKETLPISMLWLTKEEGTNT